MAKEDAACACVQAEKKKKAMEMAAAVLLSVVVGLSAALLVRPAQQDYFPEWMKRAALEARQASSTLACSQHGRLSSDFGQQAACECSACYTGVDCSHKLPHCVADADNGDPVFLEPFWRERGIGAGIFIPSWHRMSYSTQEFAEVPVLWDKQLESQIRQLHALVGNAVTENRYLVIGTGSMQLVAAAVSALSDSAIVQKPALVVARAPYYTVYQMQIETLASTKFAWGGDALEAAQNSALNPSSVIELVASPNNPDARLQEAVFRGTEASIVHDYAYYWPQYTPITAVADEDVMLFSLTKATGHAGSRIGWAIVKDFELYKKMMDYVLVTTLGVSHDSQFRASSIIRTVLEGSSSTNQEAGLFHFASQLMQSRWQILLKLFKGSTRFSLQDVHPQHCLFFKEEVLPAPAYAWIRCERQEETDCYEVFKAGGIIGRPGRAFGVEDRYVRLSLTRRDDWLENLADRLNNLILKN